MSTLTLYIFGFCMFGGMIACVLYLKDLRPVLEYLRDKHPKVWSGLGMPEIKPGTEKWKFDKMFASAISKPVVLFVLLRKYETEGDAGLTAVCNKARKPLLFGVTCGAGLIFVVMPQAILWLFRNPLTIL